MRSMDGNGQDRKRGKMWMKKWEEGGAGLKKSVLESWKKWRAGG